MAELIPEILRLLEHSDSGVRRSVTGLLEQAGPQLLAEHVDAITARLQHRNRWVKQAALDLMRKLDPEELAKHARRISKHMTTEKEQVEHNQKATEMQRLDSHADHLFQELKYAEQRGASETEQLRAEYSTAESALNRLEIKLQGESKEQWVWQSASRTLAKLPEELGKHKAALLGMLRSRDWCIRKTAMEALAELPEAEIGEFRDAIHQRLMDHEWIIREMAVKLLSTLGVREIVKHQMELEFLEDRDPAYYVRKAARDTLDHFGMRNISPLVMRPITARAVLKSSN